MDHEANVVSLQSFGVMTGGQLLSVTSLVSMFEIQHKIPPLIQSIWQPRDQE